MWTLDLDLDLDLVFKMDAQARLCLCSSFCSFASGSDPTALNRLTSKMAAMFEAKGLFFSGFFLPFFSLVRQDK